MVIRGLLMAAAAAVFSLLWISTETAASNINDCISDYNEFKNLTINQGDYGAENRLKHSTNQIIVGHFLYMCSTKPCFQMGQLKTLSLVNATAAQHGLGYHHHFSLWYVHNTSTN